MSDESYIVIVISPDRIVQREIEGALYGVSLVEAVWPVPDYPELSELERLKEAKSRCVLFLDFADPVRARRIAAEVDHAHPAVRMIAIHGLQAKADLIGLMQLGIREVVANPISNFEVVLAFTRAARKSQGMPEAAVRNIYAFLPSKPGAGTSTISINVAAAVARISKLRTLLLDFDLRLGVTSFLLKLDGRHSVQDALNQSPNLDETLWNKLVCARDGLDILGSAPLEFPSEPPPEAYTAVLNCAHGMYSTVCVDLPGTMELHEIETLERAREIFLICTSDVTGLHMAKRKSEALQRLKLKDKVSVVMNRVERRSALPIADLEKILNLPVRFTIPADEKSVARSVQSGTAVSSSSAMGAQIEAIAKSIVGAGVSGEKLQPVKKFIEYFSISPVREKYSKEI